MKKIVVFILIVGILFSSCKKEGCTNPNAVNYNPKAKKDDGSCVCMRSGPTPYSLEVPAIFARLLPLPVIPSENPMTVEGVALGKKLFFDKQLSADLTLSCAGCHLPSQAFVDTAKLSVGIDGLKGNRNSMPLFNFAWNQTDKFFWDGRANGLENQAFVPVRDPVEMHDTWINVVSKLQADAEYPGMFNDAFGTSTIDSVLTSRALAQYERTLISGNSKFDRFLLRQVNLTPSEANGLQLYEAESGADCFHCHGLKTNPLWTDNLFHNNGLDATFTDNGLGDVTGRPADNGKFKTPSLRNLVFTAPYMHDGRFKTLDEVIDHYSGGLKNSPTVSPNLKHVAAGGVQLTIQEKADLKAFLLTLTDSSFIQAHQ